MFRALFAAALAKIKSPNSLWQHSRLNSFIVKSIIGRVYDLNCSPTTAAYVISGDGLCCAKRAAIEFPNIFPQKESCSVVGGNGEEIS